MKKKCTEGGGDKLFVVRTYVKAKSVTDAIRKANGREPDEVFVSDDWRANHLAEAIGFSVTKKEDE